MIVANKRKPEQIFCEEQNFRQSYTISSSSFEKVSTIIIVDQTILDLFSL